jgi:hypothetical protein
MLGKTNLLFVAEDEPTDLSFNPQYILTSSSSNILKIEYINNLYFVFTSDDKVLYGSDINSLQTLKKDGSPFPATYIIYKNNAYYMITKESNTEKVVVYKTSNLTSFEEIVIRRENSEERYDSGSTITYCAGALLLTSDNRIAMLYSKTEDDRPRIRFILCDTFDSFDHVGNNFIEFNEYLECDCNKTYMLKDRIFSYYASNSIYLITLDGSLQKVNPFSNYAAGYFFYVSTYTTSSMSSSRKLAVYYSLNGVDYQAVQLDIPAYNVSTTKGVSFFEYDGNIVMLYPDENDGMSQKIVISTTPKGLADATKTAMPVSVDYGIQTKIGLYKDDYVYLGCTGGIIIKANLDYTNTTRPDITILKTLSAKQALVESKRYTDEKIAALEARVAALEGK